MLSSRPFPSYSLLALLSPFSATFSACSSLTLFRLILFFLSSHPFPPYSLLALLSPFSALFSSCSPLAYIFFIAPGYSLSHLPSFSLHFFSLFGKKRITACRIVWRGCVCTHTRAREARMCAGAPDATRTQAYGQKDRQKDRQNDAHARERGESERARHAHSIVCDLLLPESFLEKESVTERERERRGCE